MAKITYHALNSGAHSTSFHGVPFTDGVAVEVNHEDSDKWDLVDAALVNKFFEVTDIPDHEELMAQREAKGQGRPHKVEIERAKEAKAAAKDEPKAAAPASPPAA